MRNHNAIRYNIMIQVHRYENPHQIKLQKWSIPTYSAYPKWFSQRLSFGEHELCLGIPNDQPRYGECQFSKIPIKLSPRLLQYQIWVSVAPNIIHSSDPIPSDLNSSNDDFLYSVKDTNGRYLFP